RRHTRSKRDWSSDVCSSDLVSAKDSEAVMNELGDRYKEASDHLMGTLPGMLRQIKAEGRGLLGAMVEPLNKAVNPIMKQVSEWRSEERRVGKECGCGL